MFCLLVAIPAFSYEGMIVAKEVYVNGAGPFRFLVDTGAQTSALSPRVSAAARFLPSYRVSLATMTGEQLVTAGEAQLRVGDRQQKSVEVLVVETGEWDGVLGQSFLAHFDYLIDYESMQLQFPATLALRGEVLPFTLSNGRIVVMAEVGNEQKRLVLDSGSSNVVLFGRAPNGNRSLQMQSFVSSLPVQTEILGFLRVGTMSWKGLEAARVPSLSTQTGRDEDGLLPTKLFRNIYVNQRDRIVTANAIWR